MTLVYRCLVNSGFKLGLKEVANYNLLLRNSFTTSSVNLSKHWHQKWRKLRSQKVIKVELPDYEEMSKPISEMTGEEIRSAIKEKGIMPPTPWTERPFYISTTGEIFEPYVPPEGDGKVSFITKEGAKQKLEFVGKKGKSLLAIRKIGKFDDDFEVDDFLLQAQDTYMKAHNAMMNFRNDKEELPLYVTERAYAEMIHNVENKTIHWKMIGLLEPPRLVQARTQDLITKDNMFAQLTVRFHTQQILAIYDRFGRLMYGSEILAKDVLEYVIFEKHLSSKHGSWRIHAKIIPNWMPPKEPMMNTFRLVEDESIDKTQREQPEALASPPPSIPPLAAA